MTVVSESTPLVPVTTKSISHTRFLIILSCLFANVFLGSIDSTMVATLLGKMASDLDSQEHISWVASSYLLSCAAFQPLFGKISDVFGRKPIILICTICFFFGCLLCGIGNSLSYLIIGRLITGIGGGGFFALSTITISDLVETRERGLYQGYTNIFFHAGAASGGVLAGFIDSWFGWNWAFLIQLPVCLISGIAIYLFFELPTNNNEITDDKTHFEKFKSLDWNGAFLLVTSLLSLMVISGTNSSELPINSPLWIGLFFYTIIGFITFYFCELKVKEPIIPVKMMHNKTIFASSLNCWFASMGMFASLFYLPFYWTSVKNISPLDCGYRLIPSSLVASFTSVFSGWMIKKTSKYRTMHIISGWCILGGSIIMYFATKENNGFIDSIISLPFRYGLSVDTTTILVAMISSVSQNEQSLVTSIQYGFRSTGSTMGVSLANAILQFCLKSKLNDRFNELKNILPNGWTIEMLKNAKSKALENPAYAFKDDIPIVIKDAVVNSYDYACHGVLVFLIVTGLGALVCIYYTEENDLDDK
ncbi:glutathione exchanger [Pichia kluyveri]|uniref:Glutathione exchanger n=1 Tax=Pichia kluyveri TaxID=36015 RepID=A0AAV5QZD1_PICKL|nr:glutathione exchanger [Pichia kluyveri]